MVSPVAHENRATISVRADAVSVVNLSNLFLSTLPPRLGGRAIGPSSAPDEGFMLPNRPCLLSVATVSAVKLAHGSYRRSRRPEVWKKFISFPLIIYSIIKY